MTKSSLMPKSTEHFVYIVECADGSYYSGYTTDVVRRVAEHNGMVKGRAGARYTRGRRPVRLVHSERCASRSEAQQREAFFKRLSRAEKIQLLAGKKAGGGAST
jgi:putative endonuclease